MTTVGGWIVAPSRLRRGRPALTGKVLPADGHWTPAHRQEGLAGRIELTLADGHDEPKERPRCEVWTVVRTVAGINDYDVHQGLQHSTVPPTAAPDGTLSLRYPEDFDDPADYISGSSHCTVMWLDATGAFAARYEIIARWAG
jgi:hypothetical protein